VTKRRPHAPIRAWVLLLATAGLLACGDAPPPAPTPAAATRVALRQGELVGHVAPNGAHVWQGIPYARPPVGEDRWRAPRPPAPWTGVRQALDHGPFCMQLGGLMAEGPEGEPVGSEDCLYLNVYAPPRPAEAAPPGPGSRALPVMVWIHGGGNSSGSADAYDGSELAMVENVVVVTLNYRLGVFGWFTHPALRADADGAADRSGNYGTLDLVRALEWVRDEIHRFGGDPARVTIFGESAGGANVYTLLLSPRARGLFHRAIVQSGSLRSTSVAEAENAVDATPPGHVRSSTELLIDLLQADGKAADRTAARETLAGMDDEAIASYLRAQPADRVLGLFAGQGFGGMYRAPQLIRDGVILPDADPIDLLSRGEWNRVPVIAGTNRDEQKLFAMFGSPHVLRAFGLPLWLRDDRLYALETEYPSLMWKATGVDEPADAMALAEPGAIYAYRFDWDEEPQILFADIGRLLGAAHAVEIPFVFGRLSFFGREGLIFDADRLPAAEKLSRAMMGYWAEFARSGAPGQGSDGSLPRWTPWTRVPDVAKLMVLDTEADGGPRMVADHVTRRGVVARVFADERFESDAERCAVLAELARWGRGLTRDDYANVGGGRCRAFPL
jgi:para-nitrobenzyl esterase